MPSPPRDVEGVEAGDYLLEAFWQLDAFRQVGLNGPEAIQPGTVRDWCALTGNMFCPEELALLFRLDRAYRSACRREIDAEREEE